MHYRPENLKGAGKAVVVELVWSVDDQGQIKHTKPGQLSVSFAG